MKILVTYKSKTGFTKWYAEIVAKEVAGDLVDFSEVTVDKMSEVAGRGWQKWGKIPCIEYIEEAEETEPTEAAVG